MYELHFHIQDNPFTQHTGVFFLIVAFTLMKWAQETFVGPDSSAFLLNVHNC